MINTKLQNIIDTKASIGNAIVNKGGTIDANTPFYNYAAEIDNLSTGGGNIPVYSNWVVQDENLAKYTAYNGYDQITNPTPNLSNLNFNQWLLNNSATGTIVLNNTIIIQSGNASFQDNSVGINIAYMPLFGKTNSYGGTITGVAINNGFIYVGGDTNQTVQKFYEDNLVFVGNTTSYGGTIFSIVTNNGFIYVGGSSNRTVRKYHESNLAFVNNSANYGGTIRSIAINNGYVYAVGETNLTVQKFYEDNLVFVSNSNSYGNTITTIAINNGYVYAAGFGNSTANRDIKKYHESNLVYINNSVNYVGDIITIAINNGFIYAGGQATSVNRGVTKFYEDNLALVGANASLNASQNLVNSSTVNYGNGGVIQNVAIVNGFIFAGGSFNQTVQKFHESNLVFVGNTADYGGAIQRVLTNNSFLYAAGFINRTVQKFYQESNNLVDVPIYSINRVKE